MVKRCFFGVLLLSSVLFSGCDPFKNSLCLWGRVDLDAPVDGASLTIRTADSGRVLWTGKAAEGNFLDQLSPFRFPAVGKELEITAAGGQVGGRPFAGTLRANVPVYAASDHLEVNILTTLIAAYMKAAGVSNATARDAVFDYFRIPRDETFLDVAHQETSRLRFDPAQFVGQAELNGGFDAYVEFLAANEIGREQQMQLSALNQPRGLMGPEGGMGSYILSTIGTGALSGIGSFASNQALGYVMSCFGFKDAQDQRFDEIDRQLQAMNGKLDEIVQDLGVIDGRLSSLLATVNLSRDQIIQQISGYDIATPQRIIENQYQNLQTAFEHGASDAHTQAGHDRAATFAAELLSASAYDIDQRLYDMHSGIVGGTVGTVGFLDACTNVLIDRAATGADLLDCYEVLENYFSELLTAEGKGLLLTVEALHFVHDDINPPGKSFTGTAEQFLAKFQKNIDAQIKKFMECVDRLIVSRIDVRTDLANPVQFLPDNTAAVYARSDFFAAELTAAQPTGFIVRVIGTPDEVQNVVNAGVRLRERTVWAECPDDFRRKAGGDTGGASYDTNKYTEFAPVQVNGNTVGLYAAPLPSHYSGKGYLAWSTDGVRNIFHVEKNIAVLKLVLTDRTTTSTHTEGYPCASTGEGGGIVYYLESWAIEPGLMGLVGGRHTFQTYDDQFLPASTGKAYSSMVFQVRALPGLWRTEQRWASSQGRNTASVAFDAGSMKAAVLVGINDVVLHSECYAVAGGSWCDDSYDINYDVFGMQRADYAPKSAADACKLALGARGKTGFAYSFDLMKDGALLQSVQVGAASSAVSQNAGGYSGSPEFVQPTADTGAQSASSPAAADAAVTMTLNHEVKGACSMGREPSGTIHADGQVQYTSLEVYPAP